MGVIQRQGFKSSIVGYIGVAIGAVSTIYVYPKALEILGLFRAMFDGSVLIGIMVLLGSSISAVRFFPKYRDAETGHRGLLTWLFIVAGSGFVLFLLVFPFIRQWMSHYIFRGLNQEYEQFVYYLIPMTFFISLINLLSRYISNFRRVTIPAAFEQLAIKITLPLIMLMFIAGWVNVNGVLIAITASFAFSAFGLIYYLIHLGEWKLKRPQIWKDKTALQEYANYSWYGLLSGIGSQVAFKIDTIMVSSMIAFQATGIYTIAWALSEVIIKPMRALASIAGPVVAHHIEEGNLDEVRNIYRKSSLNMTIIGIGLFLLIWTVLPFLFAIMPNTDVMMQGVYVVFFLGLAQVWDMMTGVNTEIIYYSRFYRFNLYLTLLLGVLTITSNLIFIPLYGLTGAALAACLSMFLFNLAKLIFIKLKFGFFPFDSKIVPIVAFALAAWLISRWIPLSGNPYLDTFIKGTVFTGLYGGSIWKFNFSPDLNHWLTLALKKAGWIKPGNPPSV
jgi:O-antigen/teichoic acid export membrane protein